ncbi:glutathione peroxidase [Winogradskyella litorisediminis]|uniref:Glutathione peroxidase n=1 Tax=Winogradskyella litorisediminis TaxID=1156618 RepID=A0ABW3N9N7_9FLAO
MNPLKTFIGTITVSDDDVVQKAKESIYEIKINNLQGKPIDLSAFKGKYILFVNVASKCGFTPQYRQLEKLSQDYKDNLVVIGVPCNQFGNQEPGNADEISEFCQVNYGVSFLMTEKIDVSGVNQHPLYRWLTTKAVNGKKTTKVKWNFQKYLVDKEGEFLDYFYSITKPNNKRITSYLD